MKDLHFYLKRFKSIVTKEYMHGISGGIIDNLLKPQFEGEFCPPYSLENLLDRIVNPNDDTIAFSIFEKHFIKDNLRFKVEYQGKDITTPKLKDQSVKILNLINPSIYDKVDVIKNHLYSTPEGVKYPDRLVKLDNGKLFDVSFKGTNPTTNIKPLLKSVAELDAGLKFSYIVVKSYNNELKNAFLK